MNPLYILALGYFMLAAAAVIAEKGYLGLFWLILATVASLLGALIQ